MADIDRRELIDRVVARMELQDGRYHDQAQWIWDSEEFGDMPYPYHRVADRAIQVWGAAGVSGDLPLAAMYQGARTLRLAAGPDEAHKILIAKNVLKQYHAGDGWDFGN